MGIPDITGLNCDRLFDVSGAEYMRRYYIPGNQVRYHHILMSDPQRDMHDHPWDYTTHLHYGRYIEHTPDDEVVYTAPCVIRHKAEQLHRLELPDGPVWSQFFHGPVKRKWGFATPDGWVPFDAYPEAGEVNRCETNKPEYHKRMPKW